ncbi:LADA_0H05820g1_1 [Lachancea dasiensis]|uniref:LADA_0H05820g1_1 n=1 Tax=Lachancea dasiensis TaxID=1072105 RepID=A0A1G4K1D5_9SACH|nr:LADA_0H05820g1_1 [Lachancea dasiensis]
MEASNLQIYWHESQPIYSLCFQSIEREKDQPTRLVTAGGDNKIRIWQLNFSKTNNGKVDTIDFLSSLNQHEQAVNVVRFDSRNEVLASAGDDGQLLLWKKNDTMTKDFGLSEEDYADFKESWYVWKRLRSSAAAGSSEIYDISWSPDDKYIVSGSMDNSIRVFDVEESTCVATSGDHNHYVQGVVWDPQNELIISQSADRSVHLHRIDRDSSGSIVDLKLINKITKGELPSRRGFNSTELDYSVIKSSFLFHNETLPSFFRRLAMSPCGNLLCVPTGVFKNCDSSSESGNGSDVLANAVYVFTRSYLMQNSNTPALVLPFLKKPALVIAFNPRYYQLSGSGKPYIQVPYKLIFAVATTDEVFIYDTESVEPVCTIGNLHYTPITDLSWCRDGSMLMISSTDGFCSYVSIDKGTLGSLFAGKEVDPQDKVSQKAPDFKTQTPSIINTLQIKRKVPPRDKAIDKMPPSVGNVGDLTAASQEIGSEEGPKKRRIQPTLLEGAMK